MINRQSNQPDKNIVDRVPLKTASGKMVHDARKQASANAHYPVEYEFERTQTYAEHHWAARFALPLFVAVIAFISMRWISIPVTAYWTLVTLIAYGLLLALSHRFLRSKTSRKELPSWRTRFFAVQIVVALCWSFFALYRCSDCGADESFAIIQFSAILVFQAVTMLLSHSIGSSLLLTSVLPTVLLSVRFILHFETASFVMGGILIGSQIFFYFIADRMRLSMLSTLVHKHERENLIAELETARSMSEEARRRAEEANLAKSRFLATMSHELRTPLNAILGFSELMESEILGPLGNDSYKGYISDIHSSGTHLLKVINEILDLSRIEAGRYQLNEEAIHLAHVVEEANQMVALKARTKNVEIKLQTEENMPMIWADEKAVRQIALNLLSNALKFTPSGGKILVSVGWTSLGGQYFSVKDTGPGIPEEEIPVVLSSFGQGSIAIKSAEEGSGLGLPIVQAMMHMHDGKFDLKSVLREGTTAIATFPNSRVLEKAGKIHNFGQKSAGQKARVAKAS